MSLDGDVLVDRILPRRAAAKKATQLAAEQLESSPVQSDHEAVPWTFGEPTKGKGGVKFTYGAKGKSRSSPTKVHSPVRMRRRSPTRPRPNRSAVIASNGTPGPSHFSAKDIQSAPNRSKSSGGSNSLSPLSSDSDSGPEAPVNVPPKTRRKPLHSGRISSLNTNGFPARRTLALPHTPNLPTRNGTTQKRALSESPQRRPSPDFDDAASILTPLSSPEPDDIAELRRSMSRPRSMLGRSTPLSAVSALSSTSSTANSRPDILKRIMLNRSKATGEDDPGFDTDWELDTLGTYVWVKLDASGDVVEYDDSDSVDTLWWPAKIMELNIPMRVSLFGESPCGTSGQDAADLTVLSPSSSNVLSMALDGRIRFTEATYHVRGRALSAHQSPRKRQKLGLEARWKAARGAMLKADEDDNDGLPMMLSDYVGRDMSPGSRGRGTAPTNVKGKGKALEPTTPSRLWRAPSCDPLYEVPGELVLAKEKKAFTEYWPAKLVEYVKPTDPRQKPRYRVAFYDGMVKLLTPDMFYTTTEKGFKTCKLGRDILNYRLDEEADDSMLDSADFEQGDNEALRAPSPPPAFPAPVADTFEFEPLETQFAYVTPVLAAVIAGEYEPSNDRHDAFMRGAAARQKVCESAPVRGSLLQREVEELLRLVRGWVRRREQREELGVVFDQPEVQPHATAPGLGEHRGEGGNEGPSPGEAGIASEVAAVPSSPDTDHAPSEMDCPPSSFVAPTETEEEHDLDHSSPPVHVIPDAHPGTERNAPVPTDLHFPESDASEDVEMAPLSPLADGDAPPFEGVERPRPSMTFKDLLPIEKITYCTSVLLREAVLQLLLWRSGTRATPALLPPDEERRLHAMALAKSEETWWVHDVVFMKRAAEGTMLPPTQAKDSKSMSAMGGGTRSRPRRG